MMEGIIGVIMTKIFGPSWQTSFFGWLALAASAVMFLRALLDNDPNTVPDWNQVVIAATGVGLVKARDKNVTSEQQLAGKTAPPATR